MVVGRYTATNTNKLSHLALSFTGLFRFLFVVGRLVVNLLFIGLFVLSIILDRADNFVSE